MSLRIYNQPHTHTHTHTHVGFYGLRGLSIGVMVFILYKLYVLLPYTYPTPKLSPHRRWCISIFPQKTHSVWFISVLNYGDTENVLINHLLLVIPVSYPCHYTNLCPHKPHKHAHTHTHTHTHTTVLCASHRMMESLWIIMMLRTALLCRKHTSKHKNYSVYSACVWVRFCLDCGCQIYRSMFATIHLNLHMDNRLTDFVTDLLRGFKASPLIWCGLDLGGQNWPWPAGTKQSVLSLYVCVCSH